LVKSKSNLENLRRIVLRTRVWTSEFIKQNTTATKDPSRHSIAIPKKRRNSAKVAQGPYAFFVWYSKMWIPKTGMRKTVALKAVLKWAGLVLNFKKRTRRIFPRRRQFICCWRERIKCFSCAT
jgi:hypothetical protein